VRPNAEDLMMGTGDFDSRVVDDAFLKAVTQAMQELQSLSALS